MDDISDMNIEEDLFSLEREALALKGNKDYCELMKVLVTLTSQKEKMLQDFNTVVQLKKQALENPFDTLDKLKNGTDLGIPNLMEIAKLPHIDFNKYGVNLPEADIKSIYSNKVAAKTEEMRFKPHQTHNTAWTPEEQKRLEELLIIYPPEPVEMKRFQKIAKALGNRTTQQVSSRVQKYFLKLYKAGLPIPGRIPKSSEKYKRSFLHKHQRNNHYLWKPSTFFPDLCLSVKMDDLETIPGPSSASNCDPSLASTSIVQQKQTATDSNYLLANSEYHQSDGSDSNDGKSDALLQIELLKKVKVEKFKEQQPGYEPFSHLGFMCDVCDQNPIRGARWHCCVCTYSVDFCTDCIITQMYSETPHPIRHNFVIFSNESDISQTDLTGNISENDVESRRESPDED